MIDALGKKLDTKIDDLRKEVKRGFSGLRNEFRVCVPSNHVKVAEAKRSVIKAFLGTHAGGAATWTLVRWGDGRWVRRTPPCHTESSTVWTT